MKTVFTIIFTALISFSIQNVFAQSGKLENEIKALQEKCNTGNAQTCFDLAEKYKTGDGVKKDYSKYVELLTKACDKGLSKACSVLNEKSKIGEGIKKLF